MNYKKGIYIKDSILIDYFLPQKEVIKDIIDDDLKKAISFEWKDKEIYIRFKINRVIIFKLENNIIEYFGDIDYEGINIYEQLKSKYSQYNIKAYKIGYQKILDIEKNPNKIRTNQIYNLKNNEEFLKEFDKNYQEKLKYIFENKLYIPQEVFNANIAEKIMKGE